MNYKLFDTKLPCVCLLKQRCCMIDLSLLSDKSSCRIVLKAMCREVVRVDLCPLKMYVALKAHLHDP